MKIAVIAANGRTGREFVFAALENGHEVLAGVYGSHTFQPNSKLTILPCDATNKSQLKMLIKNTDSIASFIEHGKNSPADVQTDAIRLAVETAKEYGINRIVSLTGTGVRFPGDRVTIMDRILNFSISKIDPKRVSDGKSHVKVLENSGMDWTVVRVLKLSNGKPKRFTLKENGPTKLFTTRKEAALACLEVLNKNSFIKKSPIISYSNKK